MPLIYRTRLWDFEDWVQLTVDGDTDEDTLEHLEAVLDTALGTAPGLRVQFLNDEGEWEDL